MVRGEIASLMTTRRFLPLFLCQFLAAFNDNILRTAISSYITFRAFDLPENIRELVITLAIGLFMLPFLFSSATAGQLADKYDKAKMIRWLRLINIPVTILGIIGFLSANYTMMLVSVFLTGIEACFLGPVKYSILADHLEKDELLGANGLMEAGTFMAILFGILVGGLIGYQGYMWVLFTSILLIAVSVAGYIASLFIPKTNAASKDINISFNLLKETLENIRYSKKDPDSFLAILGISWFWMIGGIFMSQLPSLTANVFKAEQSILTLLLALFSLGTGIGSLICNQLLKGRLNLQYVPSAILMMTVSIMLLWYTSSLYSENVAGGGIHYFLSDPKGFAICFEVISLAIFGGIYIVPLYVLIQVRSKRAYRSRTIAANNIFNSLFMVCGTLIIMAMLAIGFSIVNIFFLLGVVNFITAIYICRILPDTVIKNLFQSVFKLLYRVEVIGLENYEKAGPKALIIANHASFIDPPLLGAFLPDKMVFAIDTFHAKSWWIKPFLTYLRAYPIDPTNPMATKSLIEKLKENNKVVIFPEGRLTVTGSLMKIYEGPGLIADRADAPLLPIRIDGVQYSIFSRLKGKLKLRLFPKITITIMPPQKIAVPDGYVGLKRRNYIGKKLYDIMSNMMFDRADSGGTLFEALINSSKQFGENKLIMEDMDHNKLTYRKILLSSFVLGKKIAKRTARAENVGILLPNTAACAAAFFGCIAYKRVPAMLNFSTGVKNIVLCCQAAKIKTVYSSKRFIEKASFHHIVEALNENDIRVIYLEDVKLIINIFDKFKGIIQSYFPDYFHAKINIRNKLSSNDPAVVLFTSGSEGTPKGVVLSHANLQSNIKQLTSRIDANESDIIFNALPVFHSFGLMGGFLLPILLGIKTLLYPSPLHYRIIPEMIYGCNATIIYGTDTFLSGYARYAHPYDFFSIKYIFSGAEKLRDETRSLYMEKFGVRIFEAYGATEASPAISANTPMHYKRGSVGRILPAIKYFLEPVEGIENGGKLIVSGPNIMLGYLKGDKPGVIQAPYHMVNGRNQKGWYDTGDVVNVSEDGFLTILGRVKRFAKIGGEMISLGAVEDIINALWVGSQNAVLSVPHPTRGEMLVLFTTYEEATREELSRHIKSIGFTDLFAPKLVQIMKALPLLGSGKIDYVSMKELSANVFDNSPISSEDDEG